MIDTNIVIRAAVEGYIVSINNPIQSVMEAVSNEPHVFLTLEDVVTFLTTKVLIDPVEDTSEAPVDETAAPVANEETASESTDESAVEDTADAAA